MGGPREVVTDFEGKLHHYLSERLTGRIEVDVEHSNPDGVLDAARPLLAGQPVAGEIHSPDCARAPKVGYKRSVREIVLDTETTGLDPLAIRRTKDLIMERAKDGVAVLISSHLLHLLEEVCTHVLILRRGEKAAHGTLGSVLAEHGIGGSEASLEDVFIRVAGEDALHVGDGLIVSRLHRLVGGNVVAVFVHFGGHAEGFGEGGVGVDGEADVGGVGPHLDGEAGLGDQLAGIGADDAAAQDAVGGLVEQKLGRALVAAERQGAARLLYCF